MVAVPVAGESPVAGVAVRERRIGFTAVERVGQVPRRVAHDADAISLVQGRPVPVSDHDLVGWVAVSEDTISGALAVAVPEVPRVAPPHPRRVGTVTVPVSAECGVAGVT